MAGAQDKAVTILGATSSVHSIHLTRVTVLVAGVPTPKIKAEAHGSAQRSDGTFDKEIVTWELSGQAETTVLNFMNGQALAKWREQQGLEAP